MSDPPRGRPPTLATFDYFGEGRPRARPAAADAQGQDDDAWYRATAARTRVWHRRVAAPLVTCVFVAVAAWFAAGYRDLARYALGPRRPPRALGDVVHLAPGALRHNDYVALHGITEHRGMQQEVMRQLGDARRMMWTFRLLGSRGVFVEVEADPEHFGTTAEISVRGRVVDPRRAPVYAGLLRSYADTFHVTLRGGEMVVQNGVLPGEGGARYLVCAALLGAMVLLNLVFLIVRLRR